MTLTGRKAKPACCNVREDSFRMHKRKFWGYHNSFMPILYGKLIDEPLSGTRIECHFDVHPFTRLSIALMYAVAAAMGIGAFAAAISKAEPGAYRPGIPAALAIGVAVGCGAAAVYWLLFKLFWWIDSGDVQFLTEFLEKALDAKPAINEQDIAPRVRH
jgi:hypothetical protein